MKKFIFIEDTDIESGHGWRFIKHRLELDEGGYIKAYPLLDNEGEEIDWYSAKNAEYSFCWICDFDYYQKHGHLEDNVRTKSIRDHLPTFAGVSDMESHFEFRMTPKEMKQHLLSLGMKEKVK